MKGVLVLRAVGGLVCFVVVLALVLVMPVAGATDLMLSASSGSCTPSGQANAVDGDDGTAMTYSGTGTSAVTCNWTLASSETLRYFRLLTSFSGGGTARVRVSSCADVYENFTSGFVSSFAAGPAGYGGAFSLSSTCNTVRLTFNPPGGSWSWSVSSFEVYNESNLAPSAGGASFRWVYVRGGVFDTATSTLADLWVNAAGVAVCTLTLRHADVDVPNQYAEEVPPSGDFLGDDYADGRHYTSLHLAAGSGWYNVICEAGASGQVIAARLFVGSSVATGTPVPTPTPDGSVSEGWENCSIIDVACAARNIVGNLIRDFTDWARFWLVPQFDLAGALGDRKDQLLDKEPFYTFTRVGAYVGPFIEFYYDGLDADPDAVHSWCYSADFPVAHGWGFTGATGPSGVPETYYNSDVHVVELCIAPAEVVGGPSAYFHENIRPLLGYGVYALALLALARRVWPRPTLEG